MGCVVGDVTFKKDNVMSSANQLPNEPTPQCGMPVTPRGADGQTEDYEFHPVCNGLQSPDQNGAGRIGYVFESWWDIPASSNPGQCHCGRSLPGHAAGMD